jgi:hypothetical protein
LKRQTVLRAWPWLVAAVLFLGTVSVRSTLEQTRAFDDGASFDAAGDVDRAISEYRWALRWYTPWGPRHDDAAAALVALADRLEVGEPEKAARALDALRSGLIAGRSVFQPRSDLVEAVNARIPAILARVAERQGRTEPREAIEARMRAAYERPVGVSPLTSVAVSGGFILWISGLIVFVRRGISPDGRLVRPAAWRYLGVAMAGFVVWVAAMAVG